MSESSSVRGTILSSSPCTVSEASVLLQQFLQSETVPESSLVRGYLVSVLGALDELAVIQTPKRKERSGKRKSRDNAFEEPRPVDETPVLQLQLGEPAEPLETGSKRSKKRKSLDAASEDPKPPAERSGLQLQLGEPLQTGSKRSEKRKSLDAASEDPKPPAERSGLQLVEAAEHAEPVENGSKRSKKRKNRDTDVEDYGALAENPELQVLEPAEPLGNGSKHSSPVKKKRRGVDAGVSEDDTYVKHRSKKKHRVSDSGQNEDGAGKLSLVPSEAPARSGANEDTDAGTSQKKRSRGEHDKSKAAGHGGAQPMDIHIGTQKMVSEDEFSLRTRDPDDLRNDADEGTKGSSRSKGKTGKGSHSKKDHRAAAEPEDRTPEGRHNSKKDLGSDVRSGDMLKESHSKRKGHAVGPRPSGHEDSKESPLENHESKKRKKKKNVDTIDTEGNRNTEKKHSHKTKK